MEAEEAVVAGLVAEDSEEAAVEVVLGAAVMAGEVGAQEAEEAGLVEEAEVLSPGPSSRSAMEGVVPCTTHLFGKIVARPLAIGFLTGRLSFTAKGAIRMV